MREVFQGGMDNGTSNSTEALEDSNCSLVVDNGNENVNAAIFYAFLSAQITISAVGWIGSALLCFGQSRTVGWPFYQRLLFFNVTVASMITAAIHCVQGSIQLVKFRLTGDGELGDSAWSDIGGDSAHVAVAFGLMTLAVQNLFALYQCSKRPESARGGKKSNAPIGILLVIVVWVLAVGSIVGGLNPHAEAGDDGQTTMAFISYAVHLAIQVVVAIAIFLTRRVAHRLQTDFAARGAQHSLNTRSHIKETIRVTSAVTRVLILHVVTWMASFTVAFVVNYAVILPTNKGDLCHSEGEEQNNQIAAYVGIIDCLALCFEAAYPFVLSMKEPRIQRGILFLLRCRFRDKSVDATPFESTPKGVTIGAEGSNLHGTANVSNGARMHHSAIDQHWQMISKVKYEKANHEVAWAAKN